MATTPIFLATGATFGDTNTEGSVQTLSAGSTRSNDGFITGAGFSILDIGSTVPSFIIASIYVNSGTVLAQRIDVLTGEILNITSEIVSRDENGNIRIPVNTASSIEWSFKAFDENGNPITTVGSEMAASVSVMYP